jgi:hypothetical protein
MEMLASATPAPRLKLTSALGPTNRNTGAVGMRAVKEPFTAVPDTPAAVSAHVADPVNAVASGNPVVNVGVVYT